MVPMWVGAPTLSVDRTPTEVNGSCQEGLPFVNVLITTHLHKSYIGDRRRTSMPLRIEFGILSAISPIAIVQAVAHYFN